MGRVRGILAAIPAAIALAATAAAANGPQVAVILDDMGQHDARGRRALALPGPVTYAFLPNGPHTAWLAERAHQAGKEVLLHQPMQAVGQGPPGPAGIGLDISHRQLRRRVQRNLASVPHAVGVNNHQGSLITRHPGHMHWLMTALRAQEDLFFVDSRTTDRTVAARLAREVGVAVARRDVFLDHHRDPERIEAALDRLIAVARRQGEAVAIGHPHPQTLTVLERRLPRLAERGVELVPVSELVTRADKETEQPWHASSSR